MSLRYARVVEVIRRIVRHSELLHHPPRPLVRYGRKRNHRPLRAAENLASAFRRQAAPPMLIHDPPSDLHARSEVRFEARDRESDKADEFAGCPKLGGMNR